MAKQHVGDGSQTNVEEPVPVRNPLVIHRRRREDRGVPLMVGPDVVGWAVRTDGVKGSLAGDRVAPLIALVQPVDVNISQVKRRESGMSIGLQPAWAPGLFLIYF